MRTNSCKNVPRGVARLWEVARFDFLLSCNYGRSSQMNVEVASDVDRKYELMTYSIVSAEPAESPPYPPVGGGGLTYAQGPHVMQGKNFLGTFRCMTVVD